MDLLVLMVRTVNRVLMVNPARRASQALALPDRRALKVLLARQVLTALTVSQAIKAHQARLDLKGCKASQGLTAQLELPDPPALLGRKGKQDHQG